MKLKEKTSGVMGKIFKSKFTKILIPIVLIAGIYGAIQMKNKGAAQEEIIMEDPTAFSEKGDIEMVIQGSGNINSKYVKELKSKGSGTVENINVKEGDPVTKGQLLVSLNTKADSASDNSIYQKEKAIRDLQKDVENLNVRSEYSGYVSELKLKEGDDVSKKGDFIKLIKKDKVKLNAQFSKGQLLDSKAGDEVEILLTGSNFQKYKGVITEINEGNYDVNSGSNMYDVEMEFDSYNGNLISGMDVRAGIQKEGGVLYTTKVYKLDWIESKMVKFDIDGTIKKINVKEDDYVEVGQIVAVLENEDLQEQLRTKNLEIADERDNSMVHAPIDGTLVNLGVVTGESITAGQELGKIADLNQLEMIIDVDEFDILKVKKGQKAIIEVIAANGQSFDGEVKRIAQIGELNGGTSSYKVTIGMTNKDAVMLGMSANAKIILDSRKDVVRVPVNAVYKLDGKDMVAIKDANGQRQEVEVQVGLVSNDYAEIVSGLEEGVEVYLSGSVMPDPAMEMEGVNEEVTDESVESNG